MGSRLLAACPANHEIVTDPFRACLRKRLSIAANAMSQCRLSDDANHAEQDAIRGVSDKLCSEAGAKMRSITGGLWVSIQLKMFDCARARRAAPRKLACLLTILAATFFAVGLPTNAIQSTSDAASDAAPNLKSFVGTWKATFNGEVFAILVLREERGSLAGTLNNFDISVDKDGNLKDGTHKDSGDAPLLNARFKSGALRFVVMQKDQYAPSTEWKFIPKSADEGELTPLLDHQVNAPKDMVVKPIRMIRERTKP